MNKLSFTDAVAGVLGVVALPMVGVCLLSLLMKKRGEKINDDSKETTRDR